VQQASLISLLFAAKKQRGANLCRRKLGVPVIAAVNQQQNIRCYCRWTRTH
jgi:hypothetical protein